MKTKIIIAVLFVLFCVTNVYAVTTTTDLDFTEAEIEKMENYESLAEDIKESLKIIKIIKPTCEKAGYEIYSSENDTDKEKCYKKTLKQLAHDIEEKVEKKPTCQEEGLKKSMCKNCGEEKVIVLPKVDHQLEENIILNPTCLEDGIKEIKCKCCNVIIEKKVIEKNHHEYEFVKVDSSCQKEGYVKKVCKHCNTHEVEEIIPRKKHELKFTNIKLPTCSEKGMEKITCKHCNLNFNKEIPMLEHNNINEIKDATYEEDGYVKTYCVTCKHESNLEIKPKLIKEETKIENVKPEEIKENKKENVIEKDKLEAMKTINNVLEKDKPKGKMNGYVMLLISIITVIATTLVVIVLMERK